MTAPDASALAALHTQAFTLPAPWSAQDFLGFQDDPACIWEWNYAPDRQLAGFALFRHIADEAELLTLAVAPHMRRKGIGRAVLDAGVHRLRGRAKSCFLEVACTNMAARAMYEQAGFVQVGLRKGYYRPNDCAAPVDALVLRLDVPSA